MPSDIKLSGPPMEQRVHDRLRNSGEGKDVKPNVSVQKGTGPTRTHTNIHHAAGVHGTKRQGRDEDGR